MIRFLQTCFIIVVIQFFIASISSAEQRIIEADGSYTIGDGVEENISTAKERAKEDALRNASEQACIFVESLSIVKNGTLSKDEIRVISSNIMKLQGNPKFRIEPVTENVIRYHCHIVAVVDSNNISESMIYDKKALSDAVRRNQELEATVNKLNKEMAELQEKLKSASGKEKLQLNEQVKTNDAKFKASQYVKEGNTALVNAKLHEAIELFKKAEKLDPDNAYNYYLLGCANFFIGNVDEAIKNYKRSIDLNPNDPYAYYDIAFSYKTKNDYAKALINFKKSLALNPNYRYTYNNIGLMYLVLKEPNESLKWLNTCIELFPSYAEAYLNRAGAYAILEQYEKGLADANKAIELNVENPNAHKLRDYLKEKLRK